MKLDGAKRIRIRCMHFASFVSTDVGNHEREG